MVRHGQARAAGLLVGLAGAALLILSWRLPTTSGTLSADLTVAARPTGELGVSPHGTFVRALGMRPGSRGGSGDVRVTNQTASRLDISLRTTGQGRDLDLLTRVVISADRYTVFDGTLGDLRQPHLGFALEPGDAADVGVRVWLRAGTGDRYRGRVEAVTLDFDGTPAGS
jgi:hypothetical protein